MNIMLSNVKVRLKSLIRKCLPMLQMDTVTRVSLDAQLIPVFNDLNTGVVLDVGSKHSPYRSHIKCEKYTRFDIDESSNPDICGDLHDTKIPDNSYDCVIATEVLEHLYDPQKAMEEIRRILKPGGCCILSTRFLYVYHPGPHDYYRFTWDSLAHICRDFTKVDIRHHGNLIIFLWQLLNDQLITAIACNLLNPILGRVHFKKTRYPSGFVLIAHK